MTRNVQVSLALIVTFVVMAVGISLATDDPSSKAAPEASSTPQTTTSDARVLRPSSHRLGRAAGTGVTFTEFLDFECESCRAAFPLVEDLRKEYAGRVTFSIRYFPIPSHRNAMNAALAVEAASRQGALEPMYRRMYQTQTEWGEQQSSRAKLFRSFADDLGLDLNAYDKAIADPAIKRRVEFDRDEGTALGVQGTPTFFLDDAQIQPTSADDLRAQIDAALAKE